MLLNLNASKKRMVISLTPLIDVVFILLLFFMLSSTFVQWRQIPISAPSEAETDNKEIITVTLLNNKGEFEIEDLGFDSVSNDRLRQLLSQKPDAVYVLEVEQGVNTQTLISLLDKLKQAGARHVSLAGVLP